MKRLTRAFIFFAISGWMALILMAEAASLSGVGDLVQKVDARYARIQDLQADFTQKTTLEGFTTGFTSEGRLYLKKPGLLRWDYLQPNEEQIYVDDDQVMMYVPEHQQVIKGRLTQMAASKGPLALLQGVGTLSRQFEVIESSDSSKKENDLPTVTLIPKTVEDEIPTIKKIVLQLSPDSYVIQGITLFEVSGTISHIMFKNILINQKLSPSIFNFKIPPDVVVVELP